MGLLPVNGMPVHLCVGSRTSHCFCRHLLWLLTRLDKFFRYETPGGSQLAFARNAVAIPIRLITRRPSLFPPSYTRRPIGSPCGSLSLAGERRVVHVHPK